MFQTPEHFIGTTKRKVAELLLKQAQSSLSKFVLLSAINILEA
jgi:hypothetical protein